LSEQEIELMKQLLDRLTTLKEMGNSFFKQQHYPKAIEIFTSAINIYQSAGCPTRYNELKVRVT
jgi:tetratricopeptide (TPR) repeat protein